jgi:5-methylcytosine-specific restriction enzyme A
MLCGCCVRWIELCIVGNTMDLVTSKDHIAANLLLFDSYKSIANPVHHTYFRERFRLGKIYVFTVHKGRYLFCPSRFAGYEGCTAEKHQAFPHKNGTITTPAISRLLGKAFEQSPNVLAHGARPIAHATSGIGW